MVADSLVARALVLAALALAPHATPSLAQSGGGMFDRVVTVGVRLPLARGHYAIEVAPGVRLVGAASGEASDTVLPVSFIVAADAGAGVQTLGEVVMAGVRRAVTARLPERHALDLRAVLPGLQRVVAGDTIWVAVSNRGNVVETVSLRVQQVSTGFSVNTPQVASRVPPGGRAGLPVVVKEVADAEGAVHLVAISGSTSTSAAFRMRGGNGLRTMRVPVSLTVLGPAGRGSDPVVILNTEAWLTDSVRFRASYGRSDPFWSWFPGLLGRTGRVFEVKGSGWNVAGGDVTLLGRAGILPWVSGTGVRAQFGRREGWSGSAAFVQDRYVAASSGVFTGEWRSRLWGFRSSLFVRQADDRPFAEQLSIGFDGRTGRTRLSADVGSWQFEGWNTLVGAFDLSYTQKAGSLHTSLTRHADGEGSTPNVTSRLIVGGDTRATAGLAFFGNAIASRVEEAPAGSSARRGSLDARLGAKASLGRARASVSGGRSAFDVGRYREAGYRATILSASAFVPMANRISVRPDLELRRLDAHGEWTPRVRGGLEWSAPDAFVSLSGEWGSVALHGITTGQERTGWKASAQGWLRRGAGSGDWGLTITRSPRGGFLGFGTVSGAWRVLPKTEILGAVRYLPPVTSVGRGWTLSLGLRTGFSIGWKPRPGDGLVYEDSNRNGRRDRGERPVAGIPLQWGSVSRVSDGRGRFHLPADGLERWGPPELEPGWEIVTARATGIGVAPVGAVLGKVHFADTAPDALDSVPTGSVVLRGSDGTEYRATLDGLGEARWSGLPLGRFSAWHDAPVGRSRTSPAPISFEVVSGPLIVVSLVASYSPRRMQLQVFGSPAAAERSCPARRVFVPGLTFAEVRCLIGGARVRETIEGGWVRWVYPENATRVGDYLYFRDSVLVVALRRRAGERYRGPESLGPFAGMETTGHLEARCTARGPRRGCGGR